MRYTIITSPVAGSELFTYCMIKDIVEIYITREDLRTKSIADGIGKRRYTL